MHDARLRKLKQAVNITFAVFLCGLTAKSVVNFYVRPTVLPPARKPVHLSGVAWQREVPSDRPVLAVGSDADRIYFESSPAEEAVSWGVTNTLHCVESKTGALVWSLPLPFDHLTSVEGAKSTGLAFVTTYHGQVFAVRSADGTAAWTSYKCWGDSPTNATFHEGRLYVATQSGGLWCFQATDGRVLWHATFGGLPVQKPVVTSNEIFIATRRYIHKIDAADGTIRWSFRTNADAPAEIAAGETDTLYASLPDDGLVALHQSDRQILWKRTIFWATRPAVYQGHVFLAGNTNQQSRLLCLGPDTGETVWQVEIPHYDVSGPVPAGKKLFVGRWNDLQDRVAMVTLEGQKQPTSDLSGWVGTPCVSGDYVIVPSRKGAHQAFLTAFYTGPALPPAEPVKRKTVRTFPRP